MTMPPRIVVCTRHGSQYGLRLLNALARAGRPADAVVVAADTLGRRWRLLRSVARRLGWVEALAAAADTVRASSRHRPGTWRGEPLERDVSRLAAHVLQVASFNTPAAVTAIADLRPGWILLGQTGILRPPVLATAIHGVLNAHPGWLPDYRGVHPAIWALADGRPDRLGSTLHLVDAGVDTGAIVQRRPLDRADLPPYEGLEDRLYDDCIDLLVEAVRTIRAGHAITSIAQAPADGRQYSVAPRAVRRQARNAYAVLAPVARARDAGVGG